MKRFAFSISESVLFTLFAVAAWRAEFTGMASALDDCYLFDGGNWFGIAIWGPIFGGAVAFVPSLLVAGYAYFGWRPLLAASAVGVSLVLLGAAWDYVRDLQGLIADGCAVPGDTSSWILAQVRDGWLGAAFSWYWGLVALIGVLGLLGGIGLALRRHRPRATAAVA